jgi:hypothetical protein
MLAFTMLYLATAITAATPAGDAKAQCRTYEEIMPFLTSAYGLEHNPYGVHLLTGRNTTRTERHLTWAKTLIGEGGVAKNLFTGITKDATGPHQEWVYFVEECYERKLVPFVRLAGPWIGKGWAKPEADAPGDYTSMAQAVKRVVEGLPRMEGVPLYVEIWNEPGLQVEWSFDPSAEEYAHFLVDVAAAIRSIGDDRIVILNAGLSELDEMFEAVPESLWAFDVLSSHPYPLNRPPESNNHDGTVEGGEITDYAIDGYIGMEMQTLEKWGRPKIPVIITETGYDLGNQVYADLGFPIIDDDIRADYIMRAFRDYWTKWPELVAVIPFEFCSGGDWARHDWVRPGSGTDERGWPIDRYKQYDYVAWLAKPNDPTGAINGKVLQSDLGVPVDDVRVTLEPSGTAATTGPYGNYFFPDLPAGEYSLRFEKKGFEPSSDSGITVRAGENSVVNAEVKAEGAGRVEGLVLHGVTFEPLPDAPVSLSPGNREAKTDIRGRFVLTDVIPSSYTAVAAREGFHRHPKRDQTVTRGETTFLLFRIAEDVHPATGNLLKNPGFEEGENEGLALGWETLKKEGRPPVYAVDHLVTRTGDGSQRVQANRGEFNVVIQYTHYSTLIPGRTYVVSAWVKTEGVKRGEGKGVTFDAMLIHNDTRELGFYECKTVLEGDNDWTLLSMMVPAAEEKTRLRLTLYADADEGTVWIDDCFVGDAVEVE